MRTSDNRLVDAHGAPIRLTGVSTHALHWFDQCYTRESIAHLAADPMMQAEAGWGATVLRLALYLSQDGYVEGPFKEDLLQKVKDLIDWTAEAGMYVIVDWHVLIPGDPWNPMYWDFANGDNASGYSVYSFFSTI